MILKLKSTILKLKSTNFEIKIQHFEAKIHNFEAKIHRFEAKTHHFEAKIHHLKSRGGAPISQKLRDRGYPLLATPEGVDGCTASGCASAVGLLGLTLAGALAPYRRLG